jgi:hypothetical protein
MKKIILLLILNLCLKFSFANSMVITNQSSFDIQLTIFARTSNMSCGNYYQSGTLIVIPGGDDYSFHYTSFADVGVPFWFFTYNIPTGIPIWEAVKFSTVNGSSCWGLGSVGTACSGASQTVYYSMSFGYLVY